MIAPFPVISVPLSLPLPPLHTLFLSVRVPYLFLGHYLWMVFMLVTHYECLSGFYPHTVQVQLVFSSWATKLITASVLADCRSHVVKLIVLSSDWLMHIKAVVKFLINNSSDRDTASLEFCCSVDFRFAYNYKKISTCTTRGRWVTSDVMN